MEDGLKDNFSYLKGKDDYKSSFNKLSEILKNHIGHIPEYDKIEETLIDCLIPQIYYIGINKITDGFDIWATKLLSSIKSEILNEKNKDELESVVFDKILQKIKEVNNDYKFLKHFNTSDNEIRNREDFEKNASQFLYESGVWIREGEEEWSDWQYEWIPEYYDILNIVYHAESMEEVNEVYKTVWLYWLGTIDRGMGYGNRKEVNPEVKQIWNNLSLWKELMGVDS